MDISSRLTQELLYVTYPSNSGLSVQKPCCQWTNRSLHTTQMQLCLSHRHRTEAPTLCLSTVTCSGITWNLEISNTLLPSVVLFSVWELSVSHTPLRLYTFLAKSLIEIPSGVEFWVTSCGRLNTVFQLPSSLLVWKVSWRYYLRFTEIRLPVVYKHLGMVDFFLILYIA